MMKRLRLLLLFCCVLGGLYAFEARYNVSSLGLKIADLDIAQSPQKIEVKIKSTRVLPLFPHIDNSYLVLCGEDFLPQSYLREVHQGELTDEITTRYFGDRALLRQKQGEVEMEYPTPRGTRDFFSLLNLICNTDEPARRYIVDGNSRMWSASVSEPSYENIKTKLGRYNARKHSLRFTPLSEEKAPYMDMLTFNLLSEDVLLSVWISEDGVPLKAKIEKKLMGMNWEIRELKR